MTLRKTMTPRRTMTFRQTRGQRVGAAAPGPLERSARFWLRAYPERWRLAFGDDFVGVLAEVAEPDARRVPVREVAAIVKGSWALRLRERPPVLRWLGYRLLDVRLPLRYQHWVVDDLRGPLWFVRQNVVVFVFMVGTTWQASRSGTQILPMLVGHVVVLGLLTPVWTSTSVGRHRRRAAWERHVSPVVPQSLLARRGAARHPHGRPADRDAPTR